MRNLILLLFSIFTISLSAQHRSDDQVAERPHEILIHLQQQSDIWEVLRDLNVGKATNWQIRLKRTVDEQMNLHLLEVDPLQTSSEEMIDLLKKETYTVGVQPNSKVEYRSTFPNDPSLQNLWYLDQIRAFEAWDFTTGGLTQNGDTIVIAFLDRGCATTHEDIAPNLWINHAEIPNDGIDNDNNGHIDDYRGLVLPGGGDQHPSITHGCAVTGLAGAKGNNGTGVTGVMWDTKIMQVSGTRFVTEIIEGLRYFHKMRKKYNETNGAEGAYIAVHSYSAGIPLQDCSVYPTWKSMYDSLGSVGILSVVATVNSNFNVDQVGDMPTTCPNDHLIAVTSTDRNDDKILDAGFGAVSIDLGAPGRDIFSSKPNDTYADLGVDGTSWATPIVAGAAGLLYSMPSKSFGELLATNPSAAALAIKDVILTSVEKSESLETSVVTGGRLNLYDAAVLMNERFGNIKEQLELVQISPNPSNQFIDIQYALPSDEAYNIRIFDALGRFLYEETIPAFSGSGQKRVNIQALASGVYFVSIGREKEVSTKRFVKY